MAYLRETVCINLKEHENPFEIEFSRIARKNIRQSLKTGVGDKVTLNPENLDTFKGSYYETMERNHADSFYYFKDAYSNKLMRLFGDNLLLVEAIYEGKVIGVGLNFVYGNLAHTHLSGTLSDYNYLSPASVIYHALALWGIENGIDVIHARGGRTNSLTTNCTYSRSNSADRRTASFTLARKSGTRKTIRLYAKFQGLMKMWNISQLIGQNNQSKWGNV